jgi:hypothetical protein
VPPSASQLAPRIEYALLRLEGNFGRLWRTNWGDDPRVIAAARLQYAEAMEGLTSAEIDRGLKFIAQHEEFIPTPKKFREACLPKPQDLGWPEPEAAYKIARRENWSHDAVYHTWRNLDREIWKYCTSEKGRQYFFKAYQETLEFVRHGGALTSAPVAPLPAPPETEEQREQRIQLSKQAMGEVIKSLAQARAERQTEKEAEEAARKKQQEERCAALREAEANLLRGGHVAIN